MEVIARIASENELLTYKSYYFFCHQISLVMLPRFIKYTRRIASKGTPKIYSYQGVYPKTLSRIKKRIHKKRRA